MGLYTQIWARPGAPTFGRVIDSVPNPFQSFHDGMNVVGDGALQIPSSFDRFDEILLIDDVMTTGETVRECCRTLVAGGVEDVQVAIIGRA